VRPSVRVALAGEGFHPPPPARPLWRSLGARLTRPSPCTPTHPRAHSEAHKNTHSLAHTRANQNVLPHNRVRVRMRMSSSNTPSRSSTHPHPHPHTRTPQSACVRRPACVPACSGVPSLAHAGGGAWQHVFPQGVRSPGVRAPAWLDLVRRRAHARGPGSDVAPAAGGAGVLDCGVWARAPSRWGWGGE
jgi:hypothetical protein